MCRFMEWVECCSIWNGWIEWMVEWSVECTPIVGRVDGRWMEWMGDGEGMKGGRENT